MADRRLLQREPLDHVAHAEWPILGCDQAVDFQAHWLAESAQHSHKLVSLTRGQWLHAHGERAALGWSLRYCHAHSLPNASICVNIFPPPGWTQGSGSHNGPLLSAAPMRARLLSRSTPRQ